MRSEYEPELQGRYSMMHDLVASSSETKVSTTALQQVVSWSSKENRPFSLGDFIAVRLPVVAKQLGISPTDCSEPIPSATELTNEELEQVVCARLYMSDESKKLSVISGNFVNELVQEVKARTGLGLQILSATRNNIELLERLAEAGKLHLEVSFPPLRWKAKYK